MSKAQIELRKFQAVTHLNLIGLLSLRTDRQQVTVEWKEKCNRLVDELAISSQTNFRFSKKCFSVKNSNVDSPENEKVLAAGPTASQ